MQGLEEIPGQAVYQSLSPFLPQRFQGKLGLARGGWCCRASLEVKYVAGGATLNSIRVAQWMLQDGCLGSNAAIEKATEQQLGLLRLVELVDVDACAFPWWWLGWLSPSGGGLFFASHVHLQEPKMTASMGCIGDDAFGRKLQEACEADGVVTRRQGWRWLEMSEIRMKN